MSRRESLLIFNNFQLAVTSSEGQKSPFNDVNIYPIRLNARGRGLPSMPYIHKREA